MTKPVEQSDSAPGALLAGICVFLVSVLVQHVVARSKQNLVTESAAAILIGATGSVVVCYVSTLKVFFDPEFFFDILLPPIIFEAGFTLKKRHFISNLGGILLLAVVGTLISTMTTAFGLYGMTKAGWIPETATGLNATDPVPALVFGSFLSATDPVATLATLSTLNVDPPLYALIFGESVLNDAVGIVLFTLFRRVHGEFTPVDGGKAVGVFFGISLGSLVIGIVVGLMSSAILKRMNPDNGHSDVAQELSVVLGFAYAAYLVAEVAQLSGLVALFFSGVTMSHYTCYSLSSEAQSAAHATTRLLAFAAETFVFLYIGVQLFPTLVSHCQPAVFTPCPWQLPLATMAVLFVSRALNIFPCVFLLNRLRKAEKRVSLREQGLIWFAGLRGAIAFALSLEYNKNDLTVATLWIVLFTNLIIGGLTAPVMKLLRLTPGLKPTRAEIKEGDVVNLTGRFSLNLSRPPSVNISDIVEDTLYVEERLKQPSASFMQLLRQGDLHDAWRIIDEKIKMVVGGRPRSDHRRGTQITQQDGASQLKAALLLDADQQ